MEPDFSLPDDTCNYHYCALKVDTAIASFASFFDEDVNVDSLQKNTPRSVYACLPVNFASQLSHLYGGDVYQSMMQVKDYFVLADTSTTLEYYKKAVKNNNYIETGNAFKFAYSNTPSDAIYSFIYINKENSLQKLMDKDAAKKSGLNDLKVFSFSYTAPVQRVVSSNIYLKF